MSEGASASGGHGAVPTPQPEQAAMQSRLASLREQGAHRLDPLRFGQMEAMSRRMCTQSAAVQQVLAAKLHAALAAYVARLAQAGAGQAERQTQQSRAATPAGSPLAELNRYIDSLSRAGDGRTTWEDGGVASDMKSVRRFGEVWSKISAQAQVEQAMERGPDQAGPLNSHMLMLRSLALMRSLSPDYLRRFLAQADTLLWLEQASQPHLHSEAKPARKPRPKR